MAKVGRWTKKTKGGDGNMVGNNMAELIHPCIDWVAFIYMLVAFIEEREDKRKDT